MWLLVDHGDDTRRLVSCKPDSEPVAITDMRRGQELAVSYDNIWRSDGIDYKLVAPRCRSTR